MSHQYFYCVAYNIEKGKCWLCYSANCNQISVRERDKCLQFPKLQCFNIENTFSRFTDGIIGNNEKQFETNAIAIIFRNIIWEVLIRN